MDGSATMTAIRKTFRSPLHVWVPKLLKSRDDWKDKAQQRRRQGKLDHLTIRDLTRSRASWRQQAHQLHQQLHQQHQQLEQLRRERDRARADAAIAAAPKK
jgi:predicted RNase H-like nuclease (RuvC/YqgF family)